MNIDEYRAKVAEILDAQRVVGADPTEFAAHYTKVDIPRVVLESAATNCMRQYDGDYMNDPEEGRYLVDVMLRAAKRSTHPFKEAFVERLEKLRRTRLLYSAYQKCTFLSCWTVTTIKSGEEEIGDSLNHWRFYGDDAKGSCLMIPLANLLPVFPGQLYRVTYGTESRGGGSAAGNRPVRQIEQALVARLNAIRRTFSTAMTQLEEVIQATHPLLFLFKSSDYAAEKEVRSIVHKDGYNNGLGVKFDSRDPKRAYIDSNGGLVSNGSIVFFGPKADHKYAIETMGLAANLGLDLRTFVSTKPYR